MRWLLVSFVNSQAARKMIGKLNEHLTTAFLFQPLTTSVC